jgi:N-acyl-D-amino-acid deacylase
MVRDEQRITLEEAHYRMSALTAHAAGFRDRSVLSEGAATDVVVYGLNGLGIEPEWVGEIVHDLPGGNGAVCSVQRVTARLSSMG